MSLQQKNTSLPKHLQHMRLQKEVFLYLNYILQFDIYFLLQQEEEQWISGEELCTEGSSDEELSTKHKDLIKKSRSKTKVTSSRNLFAKSTSTLSTASSSGNSEDKSVLESERSIAPNPIKWRPKRGSIKLPNLDEGRQSVPQTCQLLLYVKCLLTSKDNTFPNNVYFTIIYCFAQCT